MKILAIDTATEACSVALLNSEEIIQEIEIQPTGHSRRVLQMVDKILAEAGLGLRNLDVIAVNTGPGSFTGVRIGLGVAQGLAYGANLPVIGVGSLEILAVSVTSGLVLPAIDARMNQIYCALYDVKKGLRPDQIQSSVVTNPELIPFPVEKPVLGLGSGWDIYADTIASTIGSKPLCISKNCYPEARYLAILTKIIGLHFAVDPSWLHANYVRNDVVRN